MNIYNFSTLLKLLVCMTILLVFLSVFIEYRRAKNIKHQKKHQVFKYKVVKKVAVLIASKNGEKTIHLAVATARKNRYPVYVVSDGSTDKTALVAKRAGAHVLTLRNNIGKPGALRRAYKHFKLSKLYDAIAILDDDVLIEKDFVLQCKNTMDRDCAISVGKNITDWPDHKKWNIWIASRAYSYWAYQITTRYIQSTYNIMTCISGSNSLYRTEVLDRVLVKKTPYIVDDTYWTLETHRLKLGSIKYATKARALLQDPSNFSDWYKQNLRWMWGTFQGILGHRVGTKADKFNITYVAFMADWLIYVLSGPLTLFVIWQAGLHNLPFELLLLHVGYAMWVGAAAIALKRPRLLFFLPAIVIIDFIFRWIMVHGLIKALKQRTVDACIWDSPKRFEAIKSTTGAAS